MFLFGVLLFTIGAGGFILKKIFSSSSSYKKKTEAKHGSVAVGGDNNGSISVNNSTTTQLNKNSCESLFNWIFGLSSIAGLIIGLLSYL